jgi:hypothetical protein
MILSNLSVSSAVFAHSIALRELISDPKSLELNNPKMLRNLYILSEGGWAIKSAEIFADLFYTLSLVGAYTLFVVMQPNLYGMPTLEVFGLLTFYYYYLYKNKMQMYAFALISQILLFLLLVPIPFLHPVLILCGVSSACLFHYLFSKQYNTRINLVCYLLFFFFLWDSFLFLIGTPLRITAPSSILLPILQPFEAKSLGPIFSIPWLVGNDFDIVNFRSSFEFLSTFILVGISWVAFRRPILILFFLGWISLFFVFGSLSGNLPIAWVLSFSSIAFLLHIAPGRNFYGSFYISMISFLILLPIAWVVGKVGGHPIMILLIFFPIETILVRVFLGK